MDKIDCLDHGFVRLVDYMGDDSAIVQAARVSYGDGTKTKREDDGLINYLIRNRHTSPLEMVELKWHVKCPIFVARQWMRHRTFSFNEVSARYSVLPNEMYVPELDKISGQSSKNKQCRDNEPMVASKAAGVASVFKAANKQAYMRYQDLLDRGVARELARCVLPVNTYTEFYCKNDLHNTLNFINLRDHEHAQYEIKVYAQAMLEMMNSIVPSAIKSHKGVRNDK